jgi:energy-coupling factor transporter ATP-binding protein EcfA2
VPTGLLTHQAWSLTSIQFRKWLAHSFFAEHGVFPGHQAIRHAVHMLQARACFDRQSAKQEVFTRIAHRGDPLRPESLTIDLANPANEAIEITPQGWKITTAQGSRFRPVAGSLPLPRPDPSSQTPGLLDSLTTAITGQSTPNICRLATWAFSALRPSGPYPILILTGPPASGKSTIARILRSLIDPAITPLHALPHSEHELFVRALHNRVLAFDHVPSLTPDLSVALARLAAGTAFAHHGHHPFDDPLPLAIERPIILTVPYAEATARHWSRNRTIASLAMTVKLDAIEPIRLRSQQEISHDLACATPVILATLCNASASALANHAMTRTTPISRFADLQHWTTSAAPALGLSQEDIATALTLNPLVRALTELLDDTGSWTGTATNLMTTLQDRKTPNLPANPKVLSEQLHATPLTVFGIHLETHRMNDERLIKLAVTHSDFSASLLSDSCVTT